MSKDTTLDRNLTIEAVRVTEAAAIAAAEVMGRGDEKIADQAAVDAMRTALNHLHMAGTVVIGEGERDEAPMLFIGEKVGTGDGPKIDIALDPLEGTTITAKGMPNALAVLALAEDGMLLNAPDVYMDKIAAGPLVPAGAIDLDNSAGENIANVAKVLGKDPKDVVACILDRPRHGVDIYMGSGGAPEGVLAAAALRCIGGNIQGRLLFRNDDERGRAAKIGVEDLNRKYEITDLAAGDVIFAATGVTDGNMLHGVRRTASTLSTESVAMRARTGTVRWIRMQHPIGG
jgi:fructose-1,6-bisphosphatase II / sedoheptulose-1,7-bisphosphatase